MQYADLVAEFAPVGGSGRRWPIPPFLTQRKDLRRRAELAQRCQDLATSLERLGTGSETGRWGAMSVAPSHRMPRLSLERTSRALTITAEHDAGQVLKNLLKRLPYARAQAELGERQQAEAIEEDLVSLVAATPQNDPLRRELVMHLPPERRPIPESPEALCRKGRPLVLQVSRQGGPNGSAHYSRHPHLFLHDIIVNPDVRGSGLGAAALAELCRYADHLGLPIEGDLIPEQRDDPASLASLARWYHAAGFRLDDRDPAQWQVEARIRRDPRHP